MPQLKKAEFQMAESSLQSIGTSGGEGASGMVERKANKSVGCISWFFEHCFDYYKDTIMYCLLDILRLVPSLLKLKINDNLVDMAKEMLSDPTTGLQKMYKQLDIVDSGYCYS
ncbi:hypothetical protein GGI12_004997 [Dipsacomyces acuminosporus]|nr:hypothetical protein GGI12_004997 [Dipsacomyces acuminosporus]